MADVIETEAEYKDALARMDAIYESKDDGGEFGRLADLIEAYEEEHYPMGSPTLEAAIEFRIDQMTDMPYDVVKRLTAQILEIVKRHHEEPGIVDLPDTASDHADLAQSTCPPGPDSKIRTREPGPADQKNKSPP